MGGDDVLEGVEGRMGAAAWLSGGSMPPSEPMVPTAPSSLTADSPAHPLRQYIRRSLSGHRTGYVPGWQGHRPRNEIVAVILLCDVRLVATHRR
jgi:hypothetical protein